MIMNSQFTHEQFARRTVGSITGEKELYNINRDPDELNNLVKIPNYFPVRNYLHARLRALENCAGRRCRRPASRVPLTRKELRRVRAQRRKERRERRRKQRNRQRN